MPQQWMGMIQGALLCALFVASVQISRRASTSKARDHPKQIRARVLGILLVCCVFWIPTYVALFTNADEHTTSTHRLLHSLGLKLEGTLSALFWAVMTASSLLLGRLMDSIVHTARQTPGLISASMRVSCMPLTWMQFRDYLFAPITEEFCFRACICSLLRVHGLNIRATIAYSALLFGLCHARHVTDLMAHYRVTLKEAALSIGFQMIYTVIFGAYAAFLFVYTGHLGSAICAHVICNILGAPDLQKLNLHTHPLYTLVTLCGILLFSFLLIRLKTSAHSNNVI